MISFSLTGLPFQFSAYLCIFSIKQYPGPAIPLTSYAEKKFINSDEFVDFISCAIKRQRLKCENINDENRSYSTVA